MRKTRWTAKDAAELEELATTAPPLGVERKRRWRFLGRKWAKAVAERAGFAGFDVRFCAGGDAVRGETILEVPGAYVQLAGQPFYYGPADFGFFRKASPTDPYGTRSFNHTLLGVHLRDLDRMELELRAVAGRATDVEWDRKLRGRFAG